MFFLFRNDRLREAADCIEDIMDKCRGTTDQEQMLQQLIDKDKLLETVDYFCRNFRGKCRGTVETPKEGLYWSRDTYFSKSVDPDKHTWICIS